MNHPISRTRQAMAILFGLAMSSVALAQVASPKIVISNTTPLAEIGLETGSTVEFASNGDLQIRCRKNGANCVTANIGDGGGTPPPGAPTNLVLTPSATTLTAGSAFNLTWSSSGAEACYGVGPAGVSGWTGQVLATSRGAPGLSLSLAEGSYAFQMRCYNAGGAANVTASTVTVTAGGGGPTPSAYCSEYYAAGLPTGSAFNAHGFTKVEVPFSNVWGVQPGQSSGVTAQVPGNFMIPTQGRYMAIPFTFTADSGPGTQVNLNWVETQGVGGIITGAVAVTISPCPGDFRPPVIGSSDIYLGFQCRTGSATTSGSLSMTSVIGQSGCRAPKDKLMYINIATYNMFQATPPTTTTCSDTPTCGVSMRNL